MARSVGRSGGSLVRERGAIGRHFLSRLADRALALRFEVLWAPLVGASLGLALVLLRRLLADQDLAARSPIALVIAVPVLLVAGIGAALVGRAQRAGALAHEDAANHLAAYAAEAAAHRQTAQALVQSREATEAALAAKSRYLVSVSHEIRSPLNAIYGYAQLLERGSDLSAEAVGKIICRSSEHLSNLVDGLLDIAQAEAGVLRLSRDTIRLPAFIEMLANTCRPQASAKGLAFRLETTGPLPEFVRGDQKRLKQVLLALLSNAIKFTASGSVSFSVEWRGDQASFVVSDTGIGIAEADRERIFTAFERGGSPAVAGQPGVGLGLAIAATLVEAMGGTMTVDSTPGAGSRFAVQLTLDPPVTQPVQTLRAEVVTGFEGTRRTVLVVDDDAAQAGVIETLLRPLGFIVHAARDGETALAMARSHRPDVVLLDISMPGMNGWECAQALRDAHGEALRIVMVSADAHQFRRGGDGAEAHDMFLTKPVELEGLLDTLSWLLDLRWTVGDSVASSAGAEPIATPALSLPAEALPFVAEIDALARIGNVRGVQARLTDLVAAVPAAADMVARLNEHLDGFDFKGLRETLRQGTADVG